MWFNEKCRAIDHQVLNEILWILSHACDQDNVNYTDNDGNDSWFDKGDAGDYNSDDDDNDDDDNKYKNTSYIYYKILLGRDGEIV